jgi:LmbE family N-acetylglucosaminyl deacetylase
MPHAVSDAVAAARPPQVQAAFQFTRRLADGDLRRSSDLAELMQSEDLSRECWLFVGPHDDDLCIGGGLLMQAAAEAGADLQSVIVTDGRQGYCRQEQRETICGIRWEETLASFETLGIDAATVANLGFPDGGLIEFAGRRPLQNGDENGCSDSAVCGSIGLQNSFTHMLRQLRPARVFVPTPTDLHPDHRITHGELMISLFHAAGAIWPELGPPLVEVPKVYEMAVYCDFSEPPNLEVVSDAEHFQKKLDSIAAFQSQVQIASLVASLKKAGPFEYFREVTFRLYCPETYKPLFRG